MRRQVLSLLVENNPGVTSHISGLFSRRGYNIDSFSSGVTADPRYTRITIVASGDEQILEQIEKQLAKLEDVVDIKKLEPGSSVTRELIMVKIRARDTERQPILNVTEIFHGKIVDVTHDSMVIELTGHQDKLDAFLDLLQGYEIQRNCRCEDDRRKRTSAEFVIHTNCERAADITDAVAMYKKWRKKICQQKYFIRKTVTFHCWMVRPLPSLDTEARDMHMH